MNLSQALLHALRQHGAREIFGIPGDFILAFFRQVETTGILPMYTLSHEPAVGFAADAAARYQTIQWLMFQMGGIGPMIGQLGFFTKFAGKDFEDKRPRDRYVAEVQRLLTVLNGRLEGRDWIMDEYTIADMAVLPWVSCLLDFYGAGELIGIGDYPNVTRVLEAFLARPAVATGMKVPHGPT